MFGLGIPEILFILLIAALILGPEHMPRAARMIGRWSSKMRSAATTFTNAVTQDADFNEIKNDLSDVKREINSAKNELLAPKNELDAISNETRDVLNKAREELHSIQSITGRSASNSNISENTAESNSISEPSPSDFMSRPFAKSVTEQRENDNAKLRCIRLAKARFLPEEVSRLVTRKRIGLDMPEHHDHHRHVPLRNCDMTAAFLRIRKLDLPKNEVISSQTRIRI